MYPPTNGMPNGLPPTMAGAAQVPGQPQAQAPGINPLALMSMGQQTMGRAFGGNPYDANAVAQMIAQGLQGHGMGMGQQQQQRQMPGRTPGFNPIAAL